MANQILTYCKQATGLVGLQVVITYNDVTHQVDDVLFDDVVCNPPFAAAGDLLYSHVDGGIVYRVEVNLGAAGADIVQSSACNISATFDITDDTGAGTGSITVNSFFTSGIVNYEIVTGPVTAGPQTSNVFNNLPAGIYGIDITDDNCTRSYTQGVVLAPALAAYFSKTNITAAGLTDGTITLTVSGGSGSYSFLWDDGPTTQNRTGLAAGTYAVTVTDTVSTDTVRLDNIAITAPMVEIPEPFFDVPLMNSLRFVDHKSVNYSSLLRTPDNVLFNSEDHIGRTAKKCYYQKVCNCDTLTLQWRSNYSSNLVELRDYRTDAVVSAPSAMEKINGSQLSQDYPGTIQDNTLSQTRVYFDSQIFPRPVVSGDTISLSGFISGLFTVQSVQTDGTKNFMVINDPYGGGASEVVNITLFFDSLAFNIYESEISFSAIPAGLYYMTVTGQDGNYADQTFTSEPIDLRLSHTGTHLIEYQNADNAFDIAWTTGISMKIRVESKFHKMLPAGETFTYRDCDESLILTKGTAIRARLFEVFQLPVYMHEKLLWLFRLDKVLINSLQWVAGEDYQEPDYIAHYDYSNSRIILEQKKLFDRPNLGDTGFTQEETSQDGFIGIEGGVLAWENGLIRY